MKNCKRLKDPIYGYVDVPVEYMDNIVDTAPFQRLRRIIQTSYAPLFPSAVHNRFVHSIGVYHLGQIACEQLHQEIFKKNIIQEDELNDICEIFNLACLLHDVGHAPFSHTGESFFLSGSSDYSKLHEALKQAVNLESFNEDIPKRNAEAAAPHEVMSAIVGLTEFERFFPENTQKEFFARCITGYQYSELTNLNMIKNCFINMLNSKVIDVDKLDYLIRDAYITGFSTVNLDFERLLTSLTIFKNDESIYELAYYKNATSIIENVVYAHDAERKWIQTHPIVLYEAYLLQCIISNLNDKINHCDKRLFSAKTLSEKGEMFDHLENSLHISLISDDDIIFLMKNIYPNNASNEFFNRYERRHPIWKSEAEYKTYVLGHVQKGSILDELEKAMKDTITYLKKNTDDWIIDENLIKRLEDDLVKLQENNNLDDDSKAAQIEDKQRVLLIAHCLQKYATDKNIKCSFAIIHTSQFQSGFGKADFSNINIVFKTKEKQKSKKVHEILSSIRALDALRKDCFYLFYKRDNTISPQEINIDKEEIGRRLFGAVLNAEVS